MSFEEVRISRFARIVNGGTPAVDSEFWDGEVPWATPVDLSSTHGGAISSTSRTLTSAGLAAGSAVVPARSVLLSTRAPIGYVSVNERPMAFNQGVKGLVPSRRLQPEFLAYALQAASETLKSAGQGSTFAELSASALAAVRIPTPPLAEQRRIAEFLDRETAQIDELIAKQEQLISTLAERKFGLVYRLVRHGIRESGTRHSGVDWLGDIPEHWNCLPIRALMVLRDRRNEGLQRSQYLSLLANVGVIPYEQKGDIGNKAPEDLSKCKLVDPGEFVINSMNYGIGSFGVSQYAGVCSPVYLVMKPRSDRVSPEYLKHILTMPTFQKHAQSLGNGILAHRAAIGWGELKNLRLPVPPLDEQNEIVRHLDAHFSTMDELISAARSASELLRERRQALISAAVTGQIDVGGAS